jgi:transcriptional regulator with XRE-family HTH domain
MLGRAISQLWSGEMPTGDRTFLRALGQRVAERRKAQGLTQAELATRLGISQQLVASYEGGRRRLPVALLPALAQHLAVSVETLLGLTNGASKRGPTPKFQRHLEQLSRLPRARQRFVLDMLETVLQQASR